MLLSGMIWGIAHGAVDGMTQSLLDSAKEAVTLGFTMLGVMSFWCGIMEVGKRAGLMEWLTKKMNPLLDFLFPELSREHPARRAIAVNMTANLLGLGMAATPAGLEAMKYLAEDRSENEIATKSMCTFLILNVSSLQLIPVNMLAYRSQYGAKNPEAILGPALIATACSTLAAVLFCKGIERFGEWR